MLLLSPSPELYAFAGYSLAGDYQGTRTPHFAEVASASPDSDSLTKLQADLDDVMRDCLEPGWDGYGAKAVSPEAYQLAQRFVGALPPGIPSPSISADTEGCVTFEWRKSPRRIFLVSVHPDYRIDFAALFGNGKHYGVESFFNTLPAGICSLIQRVYQD